MASHEKSLSNGCYGYKMQIGNEIMRRTEKRQEPIDSLPLHTIAGIGATTQEDLEKAKIYTVQDLYNKLKKLDFEKEKFRVFLQRHCQIQSRVNSIYLALMQWRGWLEHANQGRDGSENVSQGDSKAVLGRGGIRTAAAASKRGRAASHFSDCDMAAPSPASLSNEFEVGSSEDVPKRRRRSTPSRRRSVMTSPASLHTPTVATWNPLAFIETYHYIFQNIPRKVAREFRTDITDLAEKYEDMMNQHRS